MANTYTQLYVHIVFAVKGRQSLIAKIYRERIHQYITGIVQNRGQKMLAIFCMPDHIHLFVGFSPTIPLSDLVRDIKTNTSIFIKENKITPFKFEWQKGYGAFTYAQSQIETVYNYIQNQEEHHKTYSFREEYIGLLTKFNVQYKDKYLFEWIDEAQ